MSRMLGPDVPATVHAMPLSTISSVHSGSNTCFAKKDPSSDRAPWLTPVTVRCGKAIKTIG